MMDYYSYFPAPSLNERIADVLRVLGTRFSHLQAYDSIVRQAVTETEPGSYSGWAVFGRKGAAQLATTRLTSYQQNLLPRLKSSMYLLMAIVAFQRKLRHRLWSEKGALYKKLQIDTPVGKHEYT